MNIHKIKLFIQKLEMWSYDIYTDPFLECHKQYFNWAKGVIKSQSFGITQELNLLIESSEIHD